MPSLGRVNKHCGVGSDGTTTRESNSNRSARVGDLNRFHNDPKAVLLARCVVLGPALVTVGLIAGTTYLTSRLLRGNLGHEKPTTIVFVYLLAYLLVLVQAIRFACVGASFASEGRKHEALTMMVGTRLAGRVESSGWFHLWRTKPLGMLILLQAVAIFASWAWNIARLFFPTA